MSGEARIRKDIMLRVGGRLLRLVLEERGKNILLAGPWGSGKTTVLRKLKQKLNDRQLEAYKAGDSAPYVMAFSPWETVATTDPVAGFLQFVMNELENAKETLADDELKRRVTKLITAFGKAAWAVAGKALSVGVETAAGAAGLPSSFATAIAPAAFVEELWRAIFDDNPPTAPKPISNVDRARHAIKRVLLEIAAAHKTDRVLLLIDDLDRCRPEHAVALLDGLYHVFLPRDETLTMDREDWPLTCVWAVDTAVLREFVHQQYKEMPSFRPEAYLEKMFHHRVDLPPLVTTDEAEELWRDVLKPTKAAEETFFPKMVETIAKHVDYSIMGNLRLHRNIANACVEYARYLQDQKRDLMTEDWPRIVQLLILSRAFPGFRESVGMYNGNWPTFVEKLNQSRVGQSHSQGSFWQFAADPSLWTLLLDLNAIRVVPHTDGDWSFASNEQGQEELRKKLVELVQNGF